MKSPFKFLDAYTLKDKPFFFGRKEEIDALYEMVFQTPLLLIYGLSGTGKTSLIQCGLASRFDGPDWFPLFIRRQNNINDSLRKVLTQAAKGEWKGSTTHNLNWIYQYYLRPTYLIFDQLEELFILGTVEEQKAFIQHIQTILNNRLPCKIIFVMREEYIGGLYEFEKKIPQLFDFRLRVERMNNLKVKTVMLESFKKFNIQ